MYCYRYSVIRPVYCYRYSVIRPVYCYRYSVVRPVYCYRYSVIRPVYCYRYSVIRPLNATGTASSDRCHFVTVNTAKPPNNSLQAMLKIGEGIILLYVC